MSIRNASGGTDTIHTTQHHKFWTQTRHRWVDAAELRSGDELRSEDGDTVTVTEVHSFAGAEQMRDLTVGGVHTFHVIAAGEAVLVHNCGDTFFRGAAGDEVPNFTPRPNEFKVNHATGTVKPTHGVSVFDNAESVARKGFTPHEIDLSTVPDDLRIIQRGNDPRHFEIVPNEGVALTPEEYTQRLCQIQCKPNR